MIDEALKHVEKVSEILDDIVKANAVLAERKEAERKLHNPGQDRVSVSVNGVPVSVCAIQDKTYMSKVIRGREMILLGAQKVYLGLVQDAQAEVDRLEKLLRDEVVGAGGAS